MMLRLCLFASVFTVCFWGCLFSAWVDADGYGRESINISNNSGISSSPSLCLNTSNNANITWHDSGSGSIYFKRWTGSVWAVNSSLVVPNTSQSTLPKLRLDISDNPHIAFFGDIEGFGIYYTKWNGIDWVDIDEAGPEGLKVKNDSGTVDSVFLELNSTGNPHISWSKDGLFFSSVNNLWWNSAWVDAGGTDQSQMAFYNTSSGDCKNVSMCLDSNNYPHVAWHDTSEGNSEIYYLKWDGASWVDVDGSDSTIINVSNSSTNSGFPSLCLDNSDNPHIVYVEAVGGANEEVYYVKWDGSQWVDAGGTSMASINVSGSPSSSTFPKLQLDSFGSPNIAWVENTDGNFNICFAKWNGYNWVDADGAGTESLNISLTGGASVSPSFKLDSNDFPHIAWTDYSEGDSDIYYLRWADITPTPTFTPEPVIITPQPTATITPPVEPTPTPYNEGEVLVYPNPFNPDKASDNALKIINLPLGASVCIYSLSGELIRSFTSASPVVKWRGDNIAGIRVSPGIYYYLVKWDSGYYKRSGKILITGK